MARVFRFYPYGIPPPRSRTKQKQQQSGTRPPGLVWRAGVKGMVPLATAIGLSVTPSRYLAVRAVGGAVLAIAANVLRQAVVATRKRQAPDALLELVRREGAGNVTREQVGLAVGCGSWFRSCLFRWYGLGRLQPI